MENYAIELVSKDTALTLGAAIILMGSVLGSSLGIAIIGSQFLQALARQPEITGLLTSRVFMLVGLVDALPFIGFAMAIGYYNPFA